MRVAVKPELLRWACTRAGVAPDELTHRFPQLPAWVSGEVMPTMRQVEDFANATHASVGFFFLPQPPVEQIPIPDYRTIGGGPMRHPSPNLLDTIYICQQRQEWYRDFARSAGDAPLPFIGTADLTSPVETTADRIRTALGFNLDERRMLPTWTEALRRFVVQADEAGVLVMVSGVVGGNAHRKLDPDEFRGFALSDGYAPLVFINGSDTKSAQMFTLAHEIAHLWLGESALSDVVPTAIPANRIESWCNRVAAEVLVPIDVLRREYRADADLREETKRLAKRFKVSTLVILRRIFDAGGLTQDDFWQAYRAEQAFLRAIQKGTGGDFYRMQLTRVGKRFASALVISTLEGRTSFIESFRMLGVKKMETFRELSQSLGVI